MDADQKQEINFFVLNLKAGSISLATGFQIYLFIIFRKGNYIKITKCQIELNRTFV